MQDNHFSDFKFIALSGKKNFVIWNEGQYPFLIFGQLIFDANPVQFE